MPRLPCTLVTSPISSFSTRRSARALIRWISPISNSTRPSTSSACRVQHSAASSVYRTGSPHSAKSEGYMRAARARHAATIRSDAPANTDSSSPSARTVDSLPISASSVSSPSGPGSDFRSASTPGRVSRSCSRPQASGPRRAAVTAAKASSNCRQPDATTRSPPGRGPEAPPSRCGSAAAARPPGGPGWSPPGISTGVCTPLPPRQRSRKDDRHQAGHEEPPPLPVCLT